MARNAFSRGRPTPHGSRASGFAVHSRRLPRAPPRALTQPGERAIRLEQGAIDKLMQEYPWLRAGDFRDRVRSAVARRGHRQDAPPEAGDDDDAADDWDAVEVDDVVADVWGDLAVLREDLATEHSVGDWFYTRVCGGEWTEEHTGKVADQVTCFARGGKATSFCRKFKFSRLKGFLFSVFGQAGAATMADEVCRRGNLFCEAWLTHKVDGQPFTFPDEMLAAVGDSLEFSAYMLELPLGSRLWDRASEVRNLRPSPDEVA